MYSVRINDVSVKVKGQTIFILDVFGDMSEGEIHAIIAYLVHEAFVNPEKDVNVFVKAKSFMPRASEAQG